MPMLVLIVMIAATVLSLLIVGLKVTTLPYLMLFVLSCGIDACVVSFMLDNKVYGDLPLSPTEALVIASLVGVVGVALTIFSIYKVIKEFDSRS